MSIRQTIESPKQSTTIHLAPEAAMAVPLAQNTPNSPHVSHRGKHLLQHVWSSLECHGLLADLRVLAQTERSYCQDLALINPGLPDNFAEVVKGVYRSSFPLAENLEALKELGLRTIL